MSNDRPCIKANLVDVFSLNTGIPTKVIYNGGNLDSFLAAFLLWMEKCNSGLSKQSFDFFNAERGVVPSNIEKCQLICLGFTYKKPTITSLLNSIESLLLIDNFSYGQSGIFDNFTSFTEKRFTVIQPKSKSISYTVWSMLYGDSYIHPLINHVQDREFFYFKLENTREVIAALTSYPMEFGVWHELFNSPMESIIKDGRVIRRYQTELIQFIVKTANRINVLNYRDIPAVNCPWFLTSEVLSILAHNGSFSLGYYDKYNKRHFSLRSTVKSNFDVAKIAEEFGGGGHRNAAGFTLEINNNRLIFGHYQSSTHKSVR